MLWSSFLFLTVPAILMSTVTAKDADNPKSAGHPNAAVQYERTFMKYHHRRKINSLISHDYEDFLTGNNDLGIERFKRSEEYSNLEQEAFITTQETTNGTKNEEKLSMTVNLKNKTDGENTNVEEHKSIKRVSKIGSVKKSLIPTSASTTEGSKHVCLHKYHKVAQSEHISAAVGTHSPSEEKDEDIVASDRVEEPSRPYNTTLVDGTVALVEECASNCYTLWLPDDNGTFTVLGQGCWKSSSLEHPGVSCSEARCAGRLAPRVPPRTFFCCCSGDYCNRDITVEESELATQPTLPSVEVPAVTAAAISAYVMLGVAAVLLLALLLKTVCCKSRKLILADAEKADMACDGSDTLATGLLCVDNLTLIEHIGAGKFGSVWQGSVGGVVVAVKLYSSAGHWQRENDVYSALRHPNLLRFYGSDTRPTITESGGHQHLIVLELCAGTLRQRLQTAPLSWQQFAHLAHGIASAVAYLHTDGDKPCIVHRDINSNNVLIASDGSARVADLGLATYMHHARSTQPAAIAEAGTVRYLAPEALEGALDLAGARAALCAVDVFALGLVLWEMLWRTSGAHAGPAPQYAQPYQHAGLGREPTLSQMQGLVSRSKVRPPLPRGPVAEARALRVAADTCDECWDHDAEARLTAVCVEERLSELKQILQPAPPLVRDNNLHPNAMPATHEPTENDKNLNVLNDRSCDVTTPLLYALPHMGRNACLERNTNTTAQAHTQLIHKSLKDIPQQQTNGPRVQNIDDNCLSMARVSNRRHYVSDSENSERFNEIRSVQRPLEYVQNDVSCHDDRQLKQTNLLNDVRVEKPKWGLGRFFGMKTSKSVKPLDTEVKLEGNNNNTAVNTNGRFKTSVVVNPCKNTNNYANGRPSNLTIADERYFESPCTLSPPNRTLSPNMMMEPIRSDRVFAFKELPNNRNDDGPKTNQIFAVIVPKAKIDSNYIEMHKTKGSTESIHKHVNSSISTQSLNKSVSAGNSESEDSTAKKGRLSCDDKIITSNNLNSGNSSRASIELQYLNEQDHNYGSNDDSYRSDCSSSIDDENLMLLSENGGSKITMHPIPKAVMDSRKKQQNDVLKEASVTKDFGSICNKFPNNGYANFDNEFSDPNDKENSFTGDNPVYIAALKGEISTDSKYDSDTYSSPRKVKNCEFNSESDPKSPKPSLKYLTIKRQHSLEQVSEIFSSSGDLSHLQNPAGRVKTPGDLPVAVRRARRDKLQKSRAQETNRLSLYDDRMMFGNSL